MIRAKTIYWPIITGMFVLSILQGQDWRNSIGLVAGTDGSGISFHRQYSLRSNLSIGFATRLYDIRAESEFPVYNYSTQQIEVTSEKYLLLFPLFGTVNYYPFDGKIDNNIAPFATIQSGPLFTADADELNNKFFDRWHAANTYWTLGGFVGVGIEMLMAGGSMVTVTAGSDIYPMKKKIDGKKQYGGLSLDISFSKTF